MRFVPALVGTLTILALYGLVQPRSGKEVGIISAFVLAVLPWHIHYARIAFPLESWPLITIFIMWALLWALEKPSWQRFALAGFINGIGVYVYKAHPLFLLVSSVFGFISLIRQNQISVKDKTKWTFVYAISLVLAANFLLRYALNPDNHYGGQFGIASVFSQPSWSEQTSPTQQFLFLAQRYLEFWRNSLQSNTIDFVDGSGIVPLLPITFFVLILTGFFSLKRREPLILWSRIIVLVMPIAHVITVDGFARRTFTMAPFLCILAAIGATEMLRFGKEKRMRGRVLAPSLVAILLTLGALQSWRDYFYTFQNEEKQEWIFCKELTDSIHYMKTLPSGTPIYFYSGRWSITYDTRKFLAPELNAIDCSKEFSESKNLIFPNIDLKQKTVWVFLSPYAKELERVKENFPGGTVSQGSYSQTAKGPSFMAYEIN